MKRVPAGVRPRPASAHERIRERPPARWRPGKADPVGGVPGTLTLRAAEAESSFWRATTRRLRGLATNTVGPGDATVLSRHDTEHMPHAPSTLEHFAQHRVPAAQPPSSRAFSGLVRGNIVATPAPPDASDVSASPPRNGRFGCARTHLSAVYEVEGLVGRFPRDGSSPFGRMSCGWKSVVSRQGSGGARVPVGGPWQRRGNRRFCSMRLMTMAGLGRPTKWHATAWPQPDHPPPASSATAL